MKTKCNELFPTIASEHWKKVFARPITNDVAERIRQRIYGILRKRSLVSGTEQVNEQRGDI